MLKKTLIALAALGSLSVIVPAQAQGWDRYAESHISHSPSIRFVVYSHADRNEYRHERPQYRYVDDRHGGHHYGRHHGRHQGWDRGHDRHDRGYERGYSRHGDRH